MQLIYTDQNMCSALNTVVWVVKFKCRKQTYSIFDSTENKKAASEQKYVILERYTAVGLNIKMKA